MPVRTGRSWSLVSTALPVTNTETTGQGQCASTDRPPGPLCRFRESVAPSEAFHGSEDLFRGGDSLPTDAPAIYNHSTQRHPTFSDTHSVVRASTGFNRQGPRWEAQRTH